MTSFRKIVVDPEIISAISEPFSPKYNLTPLRVLRMISRSKGKTVENLIRQHLIKKDFHLLLKNVMPRDRDLPKPGRITQFMRIGRSSDFFFGFFLLDEKGRQVPLTGKDRHVGPYHGVALTKEGREILRALRSVDYVILMPKPKSGESEMLVIPRSKQKKISMHTLRDFISSKVPPEFWEQMAISPQLVYTNHRNGQDIVTMSIINHRIQVSLTTRPRRYSGKKPRHIPVSCSSDVFQIRKQQRFPKIRESENVTYEILTDGEKLEDVHKYRMRQRGEFQQLELNDMEPGIPHEYAINFLGKYPVLQKKVSGVLYNFMCIDHFLGTISTSIEIMSDSPFILETLNMVVATFDRYARTVESFLEGDKYPLILPLYSLINGVETLPSPYVNVIKEIDKQRKRLTFELCPTIRGSFDSRSGASQLSHRSRIFHEFVFIRYAVKNQPIGVTEIDGDRCCRLAGLTCKQCMNAAGLWI